MTVGEFREFLLEDTADEAELRRLHWAITPEVAAAVTKLMGNKDLVLAASKVRTVTRCRNTMGGRGVLGVRVQPNHPADEIGGILISAIDGLLLGCGDAVLGVNPAAESVRDDHRDPRGARPADRGLRDPDPACCLAHITTQLAALEPGRRWTCCSSRWPGPSGAGSFGIDLAMLREGRQRVLEQHRAPLA